MQRGECMPSVNAPLNYRVTHEDGALDRNNNEETVVEIVGQLATGEVASIVDLAGRRARIIMHFKGWISIAMQDGAQVMRPCVEGEQQQCGVEVPVTRPATVPALPPEQVDEFLEQKHVGADM